MQRCTRPATGAERRADSVSRLVFRLTVCDFFIIFYRYLRENRTKTSHLSEAIPVNRRQPRRMKIRIATACAMLILVAPGRSSSQTTEVWLDYIANWTPLGSWSYEVNPGIAKAISGAEWLDTYLTANTTYIPFNWFSAEGNLETHYTFDPETEDVFELRPWLGLNFIWATFGKHLNVFYPMISARLERRYFWYQSSGTEDVKGRLRLRASARFTLNNETLSTGTYYLLFLVETYSPIDGEAREVSADRSRFQAGLGYVVGPQLRLELQYIHMRTRNTQADKFEASSNIVWLAVKHFL